MAEIQQYVSKNWAGWHGLLGLVGRFGTFLLGVLIGKSAKHQTDRARWYCLLFGAVSLWLILWGVAKLVLLIVRYNATKPPYTMLYTPRWWVVLLPLIVFAFLLERIRRHIDKSVPPQQ